MMRRTLLAAAGGRDRDRARGPSPPCRHPLGNLTVNTYAGIVVRDGGITVDYVVDLAELPTVQTMQRIDLDGDGKLDPTEGARYRTSEWARPCSTRSTCRSAGHRASHLRRRLGPPLARARAGCDAPAGVSVAGNTALGDGADLAFGTATSPTGSAGGDHARR